MSDATGLELVFWVFEFLSDAALVALGVFSITRRPRRGGPLWFGLFALAFGARRLASGIPVYLHAGMDVYWLGNIPPALILSVAGTVLPFVFPSRLRPEEKRFVSIVAAVVVTLVLLQAFTLWDREFPRETRRAYAYANLLTDAAWIGAIVLFALRFAGEADPNRRRQLALAAAAFTLPVAFYAGYGLISSALVLGDLATTAGRLALNALGHFLAVVLVAALWLRAERDVRLARALAWLALAVALAGGLVAAAGALPYWGVNALSLAMAAILGYAILQHQLLGIDVKLRFAISRSTIAAAFIMAFFVAGEGAQILFGAGNEWVGLAAAGALVFALAPLQRAAERLAEKAVPVPGDARPHPAATRASRAHDTYRRAVRLALRDRRLTADEEIEFAHVADGLGLSAPEATQLRHEVEHEAAAQGAP